MKHKEFVEELNDTMLSNKITLQLENGDKEYFFPYGNQFAHQYGMYEPPCINMDDMVIYDSVQELKADIDKYDLFIDKMTIAKGGNEDIIEPEDFIAFLK